MARGAATTPAAADGLTRAPGSGVLHQPWVTWVLDSARELLGMEVAWLSEFADGQQRILAVSAAPDSAHVPVGMTAPLDGSFCARVLSRHLPDVVTGARRDPRTRGLPVTHALQIGSYVGAAVRDRSGHPVGMLCCIDRRDGAHLDAGAGRVLQLLARLIGERLGAHPAAAPHTDQASTRHSRVLDAGLMRTVFQPVVDLRTGKVVAHEALSRFAGGIDTATVFADAALSGTGLELEEHTARCALAEISSWSPGVPVGVNLSPDALLLESVRALLLAHRNDDIVVEITEHAPVGDYDVLLDCLGELRAAGIGLSVDDVGAGYASLQHILRLHPDTIKIDIGIVAGLHLDPARAALVSALATFAAETGSQLLAEGIEEPEERAALLARGVHLGQGYLLGPPAPRHPPEPA